VCRGILAGKETKADISKGNQLCVGQKDTMIIALITVSDRILSITLSDRILSITLSDRILSITLSDIILSITFPIKLNGGYMYGFISDQEKVKVSLKDAIGSNDHEAKTQD
jgi:hypothetical protein